MNQEQLQNIIEALLMVADKPLSITVLHALFEKDEAPPEKGDIRAALTQLQQDYNGRGLELIEVASGFRFQVKADYSQWVNRLFEERPPRYSRALLETLAIVAYRQPITRSEIEDIRGVSVSSNIIKTLQEREWVRVVGHRDVPGKPELLATTKQFLDYFNLKQLSDLPSLSEIKDFDQINPDLFDGLEAELKEEMDKGPTDIQLDVAEETEQEEVQLQAEQAGEEEPEQEQETEETDINNVVPFSG